MFELNSALSQLVPNVAVALVLVVSFLLVAAGLFSKL